MSVVSDARAAEALLIMQRNREELLAVYAPAAKSDQFPRSATFRWVNSHLTMRSLASTLMSAALFRPPWLRLLGMLVERLRSR